MEKHIHDQVFLIQVMEVECIQTYQNKTINKNGKFQKTSGGGLVIRLFTPTDYDISTISIEDSTNNALFQKTFTTEEQKNYQGIEIKLTSSELNNTKFVTVYVDDDALAKIDLKYPNDLSRGIWQYETV